MRLWSLNPKYLDAKGLVALWREGLLAQKVLRGQTKGYTRHPQLDRFRTARDPLAAIAFYLSVVQEEATRRGYRFDRSKLPPSIPAVARLPLSSGQLAYERDFLASKLARRDAASLAALPQWPDAHPLFILEEGPVAPWERVQE